MGYQRGTGAADNKFYKMGREKTKDGRETPAHITAQFSVGPSDTQASVAELKEAIATGRTIRKMHKDMNRTLARVDLEVKVGDGDFAFTREELQEIVDLVESGALQKSIDARKKLEQEVYNDAYQAELRSQIEARVREEMTAKAKEQAKKDAGTSEAPRSDEPAGVGKSDSAAEPARKGPGRPRKTAD